MRTIIGLIVVAVLGFYVAWPAYTGYQIKTALDTDNPDLLAAKIDFDRVRGSLRPTITSEVEKAMTLAIQQGGANNEALLKQLQGQVMPLVVDTALTTVVTPESILRMHRDGGDYKATLAKIVAEKMGGGDAGDVLGKLGKMAGAAGIDPGKALGGLLGKKDAPAAQAPAAAEKARDATNGTARPKFSMANIKSFGMTGPMGFSVGIAKDAAASLADVTADLAFTGGTWKVVGVRPRV